MMFLIDNAQSITFLLLEAGRRPSTSGSDLKKNQATVFLLHNRHAPYRQMEQPLVDTSIHPEG